MPFSPKPKLDSQSYTCPDWLVMLVLVLHGKEVLVDETDTEFAEWMRELGMEPIFFPSRYVNVIDGASPCATVDLVR